MFSPSPSTVIDPPAPQDWSLPLMGIVDHHYEHTDDLLALDAFPPHSQQPYWAPYTTPIHLPNLLPFLQRHPDQGFA